MSTQQRKILLDFGRLSREALKENRYTYTDLEIKNACQNVDCTKYVTANFNSYKIHIYKKKKKKKTI